MEKEKRKLERALHNYNPTSLLSMHASVYFLLSPFITKTKTVVEIFFITRERQILHAFLHAFKSVPFLFQIFNYLLKLFNFDIVNTKIFYFFYYKAK